VVFVADLVAAVEASVAMDRLEKDAEEVAVIVEIAEAVVDEDEADVAAEEVERKKRNGFQ